MGPKDGPKDRQCNLSPPEPRGLTFRRCASPWPSAWPRCEFTASCLIYAGIISARRGRRRTKRAPGSTGRWISGSGEDGCLEALSARGTFAERQIRLIRVGFNPPPAFSARGTHAGRRGDPYLMFQSTPHFVGEGNTVTIEAREYQELFQSTPRFVGEGNSRSPVPIRSTHSFNPPPALSAGVPGTGVPGTPYSIQGAALPMVSPKSAGPWPC
jgi:hypothetical protein